MSSFSRQPCSHTIYDSKGSPIHFDEISDGRHMVRTTVVDDMISKEIPVGQIFSLFGRNSVAKVEFDSNANQCRLSVIDGSTYSHSSRVGSKSITYQDMQSTVESHPGGVDAVLCASYTQDGELTLEPYVYEWSLFPKGISIIKGAVVLSLTVVMAYLLKDSSIKEMSIIASNLLNFFITFIM